MVKTLFMGLAAAVIIGIDNEPILVQKSREVCIPASMLGHSV
jgi:hypothetical protein